MRYEADTDIYCRRGTLKQGSEVRVSYCSDSGIVGLLTISGPFGENRTYEVMIEVFERFFHKIP